MEEPPLTIGGIRVHLGIADGDSLIAARALLPCAGATEGVIGPLPWQLAGRELRPDSGN